MTTVITIPQMKEPEGVDFCMTLLQRKHILPSPSILICIRTYSLLVEKLPLSHCFLIWAVLSLLTAPTPTVACSSSQDEVRILSLLLVFLPGTFASD